jgi:hypothetical protein
MKKVLALLAIAGFVACNSGESTEAKTDSPAVAVDSAVAPAVDSAAPAVDSAAAADTTKK